MARPTGNARGSNQYVTRAGGATATVPTADRSAMYSAVTEPEPEPATPARVPALTPLSDTFLDAARDNDLCWSSSKASSLHSEKRFWMYQEAIAMGWDRETADRAYNAVDTALDQSSDSLVWSRQPFADAVAHVYGGGEPRGDLERGVVLQRRFTDSVWQARYGDTETVEVSRIDRGAPAQQLTSWTVRSNEQAVLAFFSRKYPDVTVARRDVHRDDVVMLPWGEGRFRSDYVTVKGEVLVFNP